MYTYIYVNPTNCIKKKTNTKPYKPIHIDVDIGLEYMRILSVQGTEINIYSTIYIYIIVYLYIYIYLNCDWW